MDIKTLLKYKNWADNIFFDYIADLADEQITQKITGYEGTIKKILLHMYQVCWEWFTFITDQNYENEPEWDDLSSEDIIGELQKYNIKFLKYLNDHNVNNVFTIQWDENDTPVQSSAEKILFNFVTHSAYHRGQLAIFLRFLGIEQIKETDFNPYIYQINQ